MTRALCIGGPLDGRQADFDGTHFYYNHKELYVLQSLYKDSRSNSAVNVWTHGPESSEWVMDKLMEATVVRKLLYLLRNPKSTILPPCTNSYTLCSLLREAGYRAYYRDNTVWIELERK